jgi:putative ABC transport system permease protein
MIATVKQVFRSLRKSPTFALTVIVTLAIGIGINAAIFSVVDNVLLRPLGYHDADRIVAIRTHFDDQNRSIPRLGGDDYTDLTTQVHGLQATAIYHPFADGIQLRGASLYVSIAQVSGRFGEVMGVEPVAGRVFNSSDSSLTAALVSASFARAHFDSPAAALNQSITYNGQVFSIVGVLPDGFSFPGKTEVWFQRVDKPVNHNRTSYNDNVIAKRAASTLPAQLQAELATFSANLRRQYPENHNKSIEAVPLQEQLVGRIRPTLNLLVAAVAVVLLIVCANITHLQLVRATRQLRAMSIRTALGASRGKLAAYALIEAAILAFVGAVLALVFAIPTLRLLVRLAPANTPRLDDVHLNLDVLIFSFLIAFAVMVVAALLPVWRSWYVDPAAALRSDSSRGTESRSSLRLRNGFIVAEVALTLTLSVSAILLTRQLIAQSRQDLGFSPDTLLTLDAHAILTTPRPVARDNSPEALAELKQAEENFDQLKLNKLDATLNSLATVPGVDSVSAISGAPMGFGGSTVGYAIKGRTAFTPGTNLPNADLRPVTPGVFHTLRMSLLKGRALSPQDSRKAPTVVVINQSFANLSFPGEDPIGKRITCGYDFNSSDLQIVGVISDIRSDSPAALPNPTLYIPIAQHPTDASDMQLLVRTHLPPAVMAETLRTQVLQSHPDVAVKATTMRENVGVMQQSEQFRTTLFTLFAAVSILLAAIGMYGVTAYTVALRRFEFGLRVALGANRTQLLTMVLRSGLTVAFVGVAVGTMLSLSLQRILGSVVGKLPAFDATAYALASLAVLLIALIATLLPARRAAGVDPMTVLRSE